MIYVIFALFFFSKCLGAWCVCCIYSTSHSGPILFPAPGAGICRIRQHGSRRWT